ncbi:MAG: pyridoxal phosphate-dependent aminotransferase [Candidatus Marinimicrobia bacterium]|nr:pyridoxal phosphate-dependent aminotransferase [Candidatus Neomarinimicrobiota bacterium]
MKNHKKTIYLSPPHLNGQEIKFITDAIDSNWIAPLGPDVDQFENEMAKFIDIDYAAALSSGTAALHLALKIIGVKSGDYVFCSDLTFIATVNAIKYLDANPIFVDSEESTWNMCPKSLDMAFKKFSPKAVIVTDLYGQSADYNTISEICKNYNTPIIEDAAESLGAEYNNRKCGSFGEISILSFNGNKIITTSGGGMLLTDNEAYIIEAKKLASQSREQAIHYEHAQIGYNYRMSNILAALGRAQLKSLSSYVEKRRKIFNYYYDHLNNINEISFMPEIKNGKSSRWLSVILLKNKTHDKINEIIKVFEREGIETRPIWKPMHLQPIYFDTPFYHNKINPLSKDLFDRGLCLPSGSSLTNDDLDKIIDILCKEINEDY